MRKRIVFFSFFVFLFFLSGRVFPVKASCVPPSNLIPVEAVFDSFFPRQCLNIYREDAVPLTCMIDSNPIGFNVNQFDCVCSYTTFVYVLDGISYSIHSPTGCSLQSSTGCYQFDPHPFNNLITKIQATDVAACQSFCGPAVPTPTMVPASPTPTPAPVCDSTCGAGVCGVRRSDGTCFNDIGNAIYDLCCCHMSCVPPNASGVCQYVVGKNPLGNCNWNCALCAPSPTPTLTPTPTPGVCVPLCPRQPMSLTVDKSAVTPKLSWVLPDAPGSPGWGRFCPPASQNNYYEIVIATTSTFNIGTVVFDQPLATDDLVVNDYIPTGFIPLDDTPYFWKVLPKNGY